MKIEIVTIGDELLLGYTIDTNAAHLARELGSVGIEITHRTTVGDVAEDIADAVRQALERTGAVITTGGLGPTADDRTKPAIAGLFGRSMYRDEAIVDAMKERWSRLRRTGAFPESNIAQAMIPDGAVILANRHGSAPGIWLEDDKGRWVAMLPGVPREMRGLLADELMPRITASLGGTGLKVIRSRTLRTTGIAESALADLLGPLAREVDGMGVAFLPNVESIDLRITARDLPPDTADSVLSAALMKLREAAGRYVYGEEADDLAALVLDMCRERSIRIAVAESCTGGMLGARLTAVPGSSAVFRGGVIAYDNGVKHLLLGVSDADLEAHGAVSEQVVAQMARGIRERLGTEVGIGITGIAGPDGGTPEKPVGTVWVALDGVETTARCLRLFGTREEIRQRASQAALDMLRRAL